MNNRLITVVTAVLVLLGLLFLLLLLLLLLFLLLLLLLLALSPLLGGLALVALALLLLLVLAFLRLGLGRRADGCWGGSRCRSNRRSRSDLGDLRRGLGRRSLRSGAVVLVLVLPLGRRVLVRAPVFL